MFRNIVGLYDKELFASLPTPKPENHSLSAVRECLFNISDLPCISGGAPPSATDDMPCCADSNPLATGRRAAQSLYKSRIHVMEFVCFRKVN
jgi:hypothetical protein